MRVCVCVCGGRGVCVYVCVCVCVCVRVNVCMCVYVLAPALCGPYTPTPSLCFMLYDYFASSVLNPAVMLQRPLQRYFPLQTPIFFIFYLCNTRSVTVPPELIHSQLELRIACCTRPITRAQGD